jgi:hypothetical protein
MKQEKVAVWREVDN